MILVEKIHAERIARVRTALESCGLTQMIVCDPKSVWYLTGVAVEPYERLLALYLPVAGEPTLFLNKLFNVPNPPCQAIWHTDTDAPVEQIAAVVDAGKPLGIDKEWPARFLIPLMEAHPAMPVKLASDCVDNCRACKDEAEQELMRTASHINDLVNEEAKHYVKAGMTERQVAEFIDARFRAHGCEGPSFTTIAQGEALEKMGVEIDKVVNLIVPDEAITKRMSGRRVCAKCGASYHIINKPSAKEGVCDRCGGELAIRKDDEPATVLDRLKAYHEQTEPLVEFYRQRGKLVEVPDQGSIEATTAFLLKLLEA